MGGNGKGQRGGDTRGGGGWELGSKGGGNINVILTIL